MLTSYQLSSPQLSWGDDGAPHSDQFSDVYFDQESGLEESRHVFIKNNQLVERWARCQQSAFVIAETGFGTGLNFLCTWHAFLEHAPCDKQLHFISVEKFPLTKEMLSDALKMWPSLSSFSAELIDAYPDVCHGFHRVELEQGRVQLTLWFGDAEDGFAALNADVDAWFLDGFAPSKNPEMWTDTLFQHIHRLSHQGTTFSTFTAAGIVRRGLKSVGFDVRKVKGFGQKREMTVGELNQTCKPLTERMAQGQAWFNVRHDTPSNNTPVRVLVVGSGLAGANTAYALAKQGVKVQVWEQGNIIAGEASGNPQGMLYPKLTAQDTRLNRFYLSAYLHTARFFNTLSSTLDHKRPFWDQCGLIQIPKNAKEAERFQKLLSQQLYPDSVLHASTQRPDSIFLPLSGWVAPQALCEHLLSHPNIEVRLNTPLKTLNLASMSSFSGSDNPGSESTVSVWQAKSDAQITEFSHVVLCTANATNQLQLTPHLPTSAIRGQVSQMKQDDAVRACLNSGIDPDVIQIDSVLCEFGYFSPPINGELHFGSTYDLKDNDKTVREEGHQRNLNILEGLLGLKNSPFKTEDCEGRVSFRCAVADYTPIVGPVQSQAAYQQAFLALSKNAKWKTEQIAEPCQTLYVNIGHGSRGLVSTPLSGEYLASLITQTPSPLEQDIGHLLHPSRFLIRDLKRKQ